MKKIVVFLLSLVLTLSLFAFTGCAPENEGPVYSETFVYDAENHWKPLLEGSSEDPEYIEFGAHKNKKGKCDCGYYFKCTALYYTLNSAGNGLICYGGADPNAPYDSKGEISVSSYDYGNWLHVEVPREEVYNGTTYPVVELANYSFAFEQIESIKLHEGLKTIGSYSFMKTTKLKEVIIPNSVVHNSKYGYFFNESIGIERVVFGNGITFIPSYCFYNCRNLKNVTLGNAVTSIGISAFGGCEKLEYIVFPETLSFVDTDPRANGLNNDNVYDPFGGCSGFFKMYFEGATIPDGSHPLSKSWNAGGHAMYTKGQWEYDSNGVPKAL